VTVGLEIVAFRREGVGPSPEGPFDEGLSVAARRQFTIPVFAFCIG